MVLLSISGEKVNTQPSTTESNYIKAIYNCSGNYKNCSVYSRFNEKTNSLISSIKINDESVPIQLDYQFKDPGIKEVTIAFKEKVKDLSEFFLFSSEMISADFSNFDSSELIIWLRCSIGAIILNRVTWRSNFSTSKVTDMSIMIENCNRLVSVNFSIFDTSKVTAFSWMFSSCISLEKLNISSFDTSSAVEISGMFRHCKHLTSIDISNFKTNKVELMDLLFIGCSDLKSINFGDHFDTKGVTSMEGMFAYCSSLKTLNLTIFNTKALEDAGRMFIDCNNLISIEQNFTSESLKSTKEMFKNFKN